MKGDKKTMITLTEINRKKGRKGLSESQKDRVVQMYINGFSTSSIVSTCEISRTTLYKILNERLVTKIEE